MGMVGPLAFSLGGRLKRAACFFTGGPLGFSHPVVGPIVLAVGLLVIRPSVGPITGQVL